MRRIGNRGTSGKRIRRGITGFSRLSILFAFLLFPSGRPGAAQEAGVPANGTASADTLALPPATARALPPPSAAKAVLVPSDADRQLGNLGDLLQRLAGAHVVRAGGVGDYLGVSLRGASEAQVEVYVDGVLQNPAADASLFLSDWDLSRVERVEVYKGLSPEDLPGSPLGGAINIVTRSAARHGGHAPMARAALAAGSFGAFKANGSVEAGAGPWRARAEASRDQADGDFTYYDDGGLEYAPGRHPDGAPRRGEDDLIRKTRRNNAHGLTGLSGDVSWRPSESVEAGLQGGYTGLRKQVPAPYAGVDSTVRIDAALEADHATMRARARFLREEGEYSLDLSGSRLIQRYVDTSQGGGAIDLGYDDDRNEYLDGRADLRMRFAFGKGWGLSALLGYGASGYFFTDRIIDRSYPGVFRYTGEAKLTPAFARGSHAWQASLHVPWVLHEQSGSGPGRGGRSMPAEAWDRSARLRLGYQYRLGEGRWLFAEGGQGGRQPTFLEKYGDRGSVVPNPSLRPESGMTGSAGARVRGRKGSAEAAAFAAAQRNLIALEQNARFVLVYRNAARARILGAEARLAWFPAGWTRTELDLTAQRASLGGEWFGSLRIPYRPDFQASLRQGFSTRGWGIRATAYYQGLTYPNAANLPSLFDSYSHNTRWQARCDLELSRRFRHLLLAAAARNVFDQRAFDFFNFPLPGRSFSASVQAEL